MSETFLWIILDGWKKKTWTWAEQRTDWLLQMSTVSHVVNILMSWKDAISATKIYSQTSINQLCTKRTISFQTSPAPACFHLLVSPMSWSGASLQNKSKVREHRQGWAQVRSCDNGYWLAHKCIASFPTVITNEGPFLQGCFDALTEGKMCGEKVLNVCLAVIVNKGNHAWSKGGL